MLRVNQLTGFGAGGAGVFDFVGASITSKAGAASGDSSMALNSGLTGGIASSVQDGDLVIAMFATAGGTDRTLAITDGSTGYTLVGTELFSVDDFATNLRVAYKFISGDTATTFGPTLSTNEPGVTAVCAFRAVNLATPLDVTVTTATGANLANPDPPAITPVTSGALILAIGASSHVAGTVGFNTPSDLTRFVSLGRTGGTDVSLGFGQKTDWASGAFNPVQWTLAATNPEPTLSAWAAMTIAIRPA
jgi:hypothetical protein